MSGFGNTAIAYSDGIDAEFSLNSKVTDINYEDDNNVIVSYEENGETKKVEAKSALVTVSLGVLQAKTISFTPELPESKVDAIDNMGFGDMNKIVLYWNNKDAIVWPDKYWFRLVTTSDETSGMFTTWFNPTLLKGVPCLVGWISGDEAEDIEDETDEVILEQAMMQLKSMFPSISEPDTVIISRWAQEEHVRGAYSFNKVGRNFSDDAKSLKERVGNVWFAGEAMGGEWHATTVGAWQTGEEAADDMISVLKKRF